MTVPVPSYLFTLWDYLDERGSLSECVDEYLTLHFDLVEAEIRELIQDGELCIYSDAVCEQLNSDVFLWEFLTARTWFLRK